MMEISLKLSVLFWGNCGYLSGGSSKNDGDFPKIKDTFLGVL